MQNDSIAPAIQISEVENLSSKKIEKTSKVSKNKSIVSFQSGQQGLKVKTKESNKGI